MVAYITAMKTGLAKGPHVLFKALFKLFKFVKQEKKSMETDYGMVIEHIAADFTSQLNAETRSELLRSILHLIK